MELTIERNKLTLLDRVFVKAITTIRALSSRSNYGSLPRPPTENRIKLYGLYKQATEGDVEKVMPRPIGFSIEDEGAKKKWDAWKREEGLSKTEAKRQYISYLIETMRVYASGTLEARELLSELEYLWDQIKDLLFSPDNDLEFEAQLPLPSQSPLFSQIQSDRLSNATPLPLQSNYSASVSNQQYRNNLQKIYSHSRRNTMLSINDYVNQQRQRQNQNPGNSYAVASVYSLPPGDKKTIRSAHHNQNDVSTIEDLRNWQAEINLVLSKLTREFSNQKQRSWNKRSETSSENDLDSDMEPIKKYKRRLLHLSKLLGWSLFRLVKSFTLSLLAFFFIVWCFKKNVIVQRTLVKQPSANLSKQNKELVINLVLNTDKNKWFIRLLNLMNNFVGFV